ncbi:YdeI/OmpD-associated family protein [Prosthecobacter sp.]|uniref:YdeI/OmpD-associated family protein n=1 Tax=Prosthecobacter sp. TaxID=1965333 RepID=UPI001D506C3C|nr:YdeI/OmpD-associated family protein [Prosthecobacter sp.]MCB1275948.1 YdeI/OmpD-associated family protein [Prosthecobacter sp.]
MDCSRTPTRDPETWLDLAPEFSQAMARQVRGWIQRWEPDLTESIKWHMLCFSGRKNICGLSACRKHLGITFFRGTELREITDLFEGGESNTSILSIRVTRLDQLNAQSFRRLLHAAVALDADESAKPPPQKKRAEWPMPDALAKALRKHPAAAAGFNSMSVSCQREYKVWISTAKQEETIQRRLKETLRALSAGKKWAQRK